MIRFASAVQTPYTRPCLCAGMRSHANFERLRLPLQPRKTIPAPAPAPRKMSQQLRLRLRVKCNGQNEQNVISWHFAPSEMSQQLRLRLGAKCTGSDGSGSGSGSRDAKSCKFGTAPAPAPSKKKKITRFRLRPEFSSGSSSQRNVLAAAPHRCLCDHVPWLKIHVCTYNISISCCNEIIWTCF